MTRRAWLAFAAASVIWGIPYLFIRIAVRDGITPPVLAWGRVTLGAFVVVLGLVCTAVAFVIFTVLIREAGTSRATVITYINPLRRLWASRCSASAPEQAPSPGCC